MLEIQGSSRRPSPHAARSRALRALSLICAAGLAAACALGAGDPDPASLALRPPPAPAVDDEAFSIVILPDTQFYTQAFPEIFSAQTRWILDQRQARRIAFVLHEGDLVNVDVEDQWRVAASSLHALDGVVPYVLSVGNHDLAWQGGRLSRSCDGFNRHFPADGVTASPWPTGLFEPGHLENHYQLLDAFGMKFLVLSLEFGPRDAVVAWADRVLGRYPALPAILLTHAYLARGNGRFRDQPFHPCGDGPNEFTDCNDGEALWEKLVSRHDNVVFVFSGHDLFPGVARLTSPLPSGRRVHQVLANYQTCGGLPCVVPDTGRTTKGGDGFLRIVTIDRRQRRAQVETYSPYLDGRGEDPVKADPDQRFTLDLDPWMFRPPPPRAAIAFGREGGAEVDDGPLTVRQALGAADRCDGIQVVLPALDAGGGPRSLRALRACLDGACERFSLDDALTCRAARPGSPISCVNDEGMIHLFFFGAVRAGPAVHVVAEDAAGAVLFDQVDRVTASARGGCYAGVHVMSPR